MPACGRLVPFGDLVLKPPLSSPPYPGHRGRPTPGRDVVRFAMHRCSASVLYAVDQGWLELEGAHSACLTEEGRRMMANPGPWTTARAACDQVPSWERKELRHVGIELECASNPLASTQRSSHGSHHGADRRGHHSTLGRRLVRPWTLVLSKVGLVLRPEERPACGRRHGFQGPTTRELD